MWFESSKYFPCLLHALIVLFQGGLLIVCNKFAKQFAINYAVIFIAVTHFRGQKLTFPMPQREKGQGVSITTQPSVGSYPGSFSSQEKIKCICSKTSLICLQTTGHIRWDPVNTAGLDSGVPRELKPVGSNSEGFAEQWALWIQGFACFVLGGGICLGFFFIHSLTKSNILRGSTPISTVLHFTTTTKMFL